MQGELLEGGVVASAALKTSAERSIMIVPLHGVVPLVHLRGNGRVFHVRLLVREEVIFLLGDLTEGLILQLAVMVFTLLFGNFLRDIVVFGDVFDLVLEVDALARATLLHGVRLNIGRRRYNSVLILVLFRLRRSLRHVWVRCLVQPLFGIGG